MLVASSSTSLEAGLMLSSAGMSHRVADINMLRLTQCHEQSVKQHCNLSSMPALSNRLLHKAA